MNKENAMQLINERFPDEYRIFIMEIDEKKRKIEYSFSFDEEAYTENDVRFQCILSYFEEHEVEND